MLLFDTIRYGSRLVDFTVLARGTSMPRIAVFVQPGLAGSSKFLMDPVMAQQIPTGVCLVTTSRPGAGFTTVCPTEQRLKAVVEDATVVADSLGVKVIGTVGHSLGCLYAPHIALSFGLGPARTHLYAPPKVFERGWNEIKEQVAGTGWWHRNMMYWILEKPQVARGLLDAGRLLWWTRPRVLLRGCRNSVSLVDQDLLDRPVLRPMFLRDTRHYMRGPNAFHEDMAYWLRHATVNDLKVAHGASVYWGSQDNVLTEPMLRDASSQRGVTPLVLENEGHFLLFKRLGLELERVLDLAHS